MNAPTPTGPLPALTNWDEIAGRVAGKRPVLFLDYDGTLTPIVARPEQARLAPQMREVLQKLASRCAVAIVSGRDRADVMQFVGLEELYYAGSHGFDISGPNGLRMQQEAGVACLPDLDRAEQQLHAELDRIDGAQVERKRFAIAVHYRNVRDGDVTRIEKVVDDVHASHSRLRKRGGKKIFELQPNVEWDKGRAVLWLLQVLPLDEHETVPFYLGDDLTDEDAFRALQGRGIGVIVGETVEQTAAEYRLENTQEVLQFLSKFANDWRDGT
jgi:trehalose-phosphatase